MSTGAADSVAPLVALCHVLMPIDPTLEAEVQVACSRGGPEDGWSTLLEGLQARQRLVTIDWRATLEDVMAAVDRLLRDHPADPQRWIWVDRTQWDASNLDAFLDVAGERLYQHKLVLVYFAALTDSYPLALVDDQDYPLVEALAARAGFGVEACRQGDPL